MDVQGDYGTQTETFFNCLTMKIIDNTREPRSKTFSSTHVSGRATIQPKMPDWDPSRRRPGVSGRSVLYVSKLLREGFSGITH